MTIACSSCKRSVANITGSTQFSCPGCNNSMIIRCMDCRRIAARYACQACNFSGPN